jgi:hypothetical protein
MYQHRNFLRIEAKTGYGLTNFRYKELIYRIINSLKPRQYLSEDDQLVQGQFEEIFEVIFIMKGNISVGYQLINNTFFAKTLR